MLYAVTAADNATVAIVAVATATEAAVSYVSAISAIAAVSEVAAVVVEYVVAYSIDVASDATFPVALSIFAGVANADFVGIANVIAEAAALPTAVDCYW